MKSVVLKLISLRFSLNKKKYHKFYKFLQQFTEDIDEAEELTEEVSVCPEVVVLEVGVEVVQQQLLLLSLLRFSKQTLG